VSKDHLVINESCYFFMCVKPHTFDEMRDGVIGPVTCA